ncbi:hypothetical protein [Kitasatospora sp. NPDC059673]|uniref:hypothetical protein n=1 Tax=Kitasatospora sp. NPDC059673 TaxID=3346901 RepID=UPI0036AF0905
MNGTAFLASVIATGRLHGIGIGSPIADVGRAFRSAWIDDVVEAGVSLRRDYGLVELYFNGPEWTVVGGSVELHRLATVAGLAEEWRKAEGIEFSEYLPWSEVETALAPTRSATAGRGTATCSALPWASRGYPPVCPLLLAREHRSLVRH